MRIEIETKTEGIGMSEKNSMKYHAIHPRQLITNKIFSKKANMKGKGERERWAWWIKFKDTVFLDYLMKT